MKINHEQQLYVIPCSYGYTCLGFDYCQRRSDKMAAWLNERGFSHLNSETPGTVEAYEKYTQLVEDVRVYCQHNKTRCDINLTPQLIGLEGKRVEVSHNGERRRFIVGKSTGFMPVHMEIKTKRSLGGEPVGSFDSLRVL